MRLQLSDRADALVDLLFEAVIQRRELDRPPRQLYCTHLNPPFQLIVRFLQFQMQSSESALTPEYTYRLHRDEQAQKTQSYYSSNPQTGQAHLQLHGCRCYGTHEIAVDGDHFEGVDAQR